MHPNSPPSPPRLSLHVEIEGRDFPIRRENQEEMLKEKERQKFHKSKRSGWRLKYQEVNVVHHGPTCPLHTCTRLLYKRACANVDPVPTLFHLHSQKFV
jgi:hypothetical protein